MPAEFRLSQAALSDIDSVLAASRRWSGVPSAGAAFPI